MKKCYAFLLLFFIAFNAFGQQTVNLFPTLGTKHISEQGLIETANSIFVPMRLFATTPRPNSGGSTFANSYTLYKFNKATSTFTDSVLLSGDTANNNLICRPRYAASCYSNGKMYFLSTKYLFRTGMQNSDSDRFYLSVVDTNLNVLFADRLVVETKKWTGVRLIKSMIFHQDRLLVNTRTTIADGINNHNYPTLFLLDANGTLLKDTIAGTLTSPQSSSSEVTALVKEIGVDTTLFIGGNWLSKGITGFYKTSLNLDVTKDYGALSPPPPIIYTPTYSWYEDDYSTSFSDVIDGQLFTAGENRDDTIYNNTPALTRATFISKHRRADNFRRSRLLLLLNSSLFNESGNNQLSHKVLYSKAANRLYYVNFNHSLGISSCDTAENAIQIVCVDTNLNLRWRKLISPKAGTCAQTIQAFLPEKGTGLTIAGNYFDNNSPGDKNLSGTFLLRLDSAGLLSTGNTPNFAIRDRFSVYPNPATSTIWVEDIAGIPAKAALYDLVGRQVAVYTLTGRKNRLELPAGKPGIYLLRIVPQWGEGWSQMVQVGE